MKRWMRILPLFCLSALLCATLAAAELTPTPLNCHEMAALWFANQDEAQLLDADGGGAEAALSDYFAAREAAFRGDMRLLSADEDMSASVAESAVLRTEQVREMESRLGFNVLDADVTARAERESSTRNADGTLTLYVYEWTFYDYDDLSDGAGGLDVSGFGTWHILTVAERPDGSFEILADEYDESDILGISTLSAERQQELLDRASAEPDVPYTAEPADAASLLAINYYSNYDVEKAVAYSEQYWGGLSGKTYKEGDKEESNENYNSAYANFNPYGGDCANFTSQSIYAGGMPQVVTKPYASDGWYYKTSTDRSATWASATSLHHWMRDNRGHCVTASKTTVFKGSPVFYSKSSYSGDSKQENISFSHAVLCVGTNSAGTPIVNSHNTNRWHAIWNYYYSGSNATIDTVQLTSEKFGSFSGYVKLEADFYANIINPSLSRYVTNDGEGKVSSRAETKEAGQVWRFTLQNDGSYLIESALKDGSQKTPALAVAGGEWDSRTPICTENDAAQPGQRWYVYWDSGEFSWGKGAYLLRPQCSDRVMDIVEGSAEEGAGLWLFSKNGTEAQLFQIYQTTWVELDAPVLDVKLEGSEGANITFSWGAIDGASTYNLRITPDGGQTSSVTVRRNVSYAMNLKPGDYHATLEAVSANGRTKSVSDAISFNVPTSYTITFNPNGGEDGPTQQIKIQQIDATLPEEVPVYKGYDFASWNTQADGTGATYMPGGVYAEDMDLCLYARWTPSKFTVTLAPNVGSSGELSDEEIVVTYREAYGELPSLVREGQYEFAGWYTEQTEGDLVTAETMVTLTENHTLYAHWNSTAVYLLPEVRKSGNRHQIITAFHRIPKGVLFACGYLNGQMADVVSGDIAENQEELTLELEGEFDKILVIAVDSDIRPVCKAESWPT